MKSLQEIKEETINNGINATVEEAINHFEMKLEQELKAELKRLEEDDKKNKGLNNIHWTYHSSNLAVQEFIKEMLK